MKNFVLVEKKWDSRFDSRILAGKAYSESADRYLPESVSRSMSKNDKALLMILSERLEMHPMMVLSEGFLDTIKNMFGIGKKAAEQSDDPEVRALADEMEAMAKRNQGFIGRFQKARKGSAGSTPASVWQSAKYAAGGGLWPQFSAHGETVWPGGEKGKKLRAQMNLNFEKLQKQLGGELKQVWGQLAKQLKELPKPDEGGFPNNPNPKDFVQVMYGPQFETMADVEAVLKSGKPQLGGLVGTILGSRTLLQQFIDQGVLSVEDAEKMMKKAIEVFAYYKGALERQYFTLENKNGKDGPLLHYTSMKNLMFEETGIPKSPEDIPAVVEVELEELEMPEAEEEAELEPEQEEQIENLTADQLKAIMSGNYEESGIDVSVIEKTQIEKKAKYFFIAAGVIAVAGALMFLFGGDSETVELIQKAKEEELQKFRMVPEDKLKDFKMTPDNMDGMGPLSNEFLENNHIQKVFEIHKGDGITYLRPPEFEGLSAKEIQDMDINKWSKTFLGQFENKEQFVDSFKDNMSDPGTAWDQLQKGGTGDVKSFFGPGSSMGKPWALTKTGAINIVKKSISKQIGSTVKNVIAGGLKDPGKSIMKIGSASGAAAKAATAGSLVVAAAPYVLGAAGVALALGLVRKYKNSRQKQLQGAISLIREPFTLAPTNAPDWEEVGIDPEIVPPEPTPDMGPPPSPIEQEEVAKSLDLVKRALKKSGYPEEDIEPLLNSLWDGLPPNPKAPTNLTSDSEQELLRTNAWRKYSLFPLLTESPTLMLEDVEYKKFAEYMKNAAKHAKVKEPNKTQMQQAAFAFNIANGIGDVTGLPEKYKKAGSRKKLEKLKKRLKDMEKEKKGMVSKKWKKKAKNREKVVDKLEDKLKDLKGVKEKAKKDLEKALIELEQGKIQASEYLEHIKALEENQMLTADETDQLVMDLESQIEMLTTAKNEETLALQQEIADMSYELEGLKDLKPGSEAANKVFDLINKHYPDTDPGLFFSDPNQFLEQWMADTKSPYEEDIRKAQKANEQLSGELESLRQQLEGMQGASTKNIDTQKMYSFLKTVQRTLRSSSFPATPPDEFESLSKTPKRNFKNLAKTVIGTANSELGTDLTYENTWRKGNLLREQRETNMTFARWRKLAGLE